MEIIGTGKNDLKFIRYKAFNSKLFLPISTYVSYKLEHDWDDYNELFHAVNYIQNIKNIEGVWFDIHTVQNNDRIIGVLTIVGGEIEKLGIPHDSQTTSTLLLKYFHIIDKGMGYGSYWLKSVIFPYYQSKNYSKILISSSHPKSFNFYEKIGEEMESYTKMSDNQLHERKCKTFSISL
ncbi:MAG: hypothetical protein CMP12_13075 [Zunongwangia sp.]|uniref:N-acetyltransferase domain-containing protein n=2 Tax=Zunongwangia profunda TaxID=398743 RepID=D5BKV0_ZUNPS|nr:hypothetical protein [Zunongwangia profunda]MAC64933.1 hypothetical protein [Flavobacteriaceae bacterium]MAO36812.1 hypothetical protein [Zunongwangia sp.]ADF51849.1 conserved hypothetical protein [Zunongwangia profunda SM-A87]MAS69155.1 hypothetical protein [Zunongwangia sp.]HCV80320.1 hypothetical protein [Zunongwangia profunda]|tara:strand:- start:1782 stop:2318 length:537 start_codon:yes stop_codon:yes gene_type:complete